MLMLIMHLPFLKKCFHDFNTSHVNVNHNGSICYVQMFHDFNTSHVNVNQHHRTREFYLKDNFNTSHVNVNLLSP